MSASVPQEELPILESVINIRNRLTALKKNRAEFIKASDVNSLYQAVVKQVTKLNDVRNDNDTYNNRLDTTLADVFTLLSLFYLTIGKTRDTPAIYSQLASMRQILNHMTESAVYNESDLAPFQRRLSDLRQIVQRDASTGKHPEALTKLLERQLGECDGIVRNLQEGLAVLSDELVPIHEKLVTLRRKLVALGSREGSHKAELKPIMEELRKIDSKRVDGRFLGPGGTVPSSQANCSSLLENCFEIAQEIKANEESKNVPESLKPIYDRLSEIRQELENLVLTHRWSLRETDLWNYSLSLQEIDKMRIDGKFMDSEGNRPDGQYVLLYLLRRCYGLIYRLLSSSEPVSEELMPIANKLNTVKKCLNEVLKYGGPWSPRDLYPVRSAFISYQSRSSLPALCENLTSVGPITYDPLILSLLLMVQYQLALHQIESRRKDGKFIGIDGSIPEGQGIVMAHLNECHELIEMLKESMDEDEAGEDDEDDEEYDEDEEEESGSDAETPS